MQSPINKHNITTLLEYLNTVTIWIPNIRLFTHFLFGFIWSDKVENRTFYTVNHTFFVQFSDNPFENRTICQQVTFGSFEYQTGPGFKWLLYRTFQGNIIWNIWIPDIQNQGTSRNRIFSSYAFKWPDHSKSGQNIENVWNFGPVIKQWFNTAILCWVFKWKSVQ